jgi:anti-sigma B factor antagonist
MHIAERRVDDVTLLTLVGRMVLREGDIPLRDYIDTLAGQGRVRLVLDMKQVSYLDSAGIGMLVAKYLSVRRLGGAIKLLNLTARTHRPLAVTKLSSVFEIFDSEDAALRSFAQETV